MKRDVSTMFRTGALYAAFILLIGCRAPTVGLPDMSLAPWSKREPATVESVSSTASVEKRTKDQISIEAARLLEQQGELARAENVYQQLPPSVARLHRLAVINDRQGKHQVATQFYEQAISEDGSDPELWCDYGYSCYLHGRMKQAESCLRRALELEPEMKRARNNLGLVLARLGQRQDAEKQFVTAGCTLDEARANCKLATTDKFNMTDDAASPAEQHATPPHFVLPASSRRIAGL